MVDEGGAMKAEAGAACDVQHPSLSEWFCCWNTVEALARDASRLYEKCGTKCSLAELAEWRERVMAQVSKAMKDEEFIFNALKQMDGAPEDLGGAVLDAAA